MQNTLIESMFINFMVFSFFQKYDKAMVDSAEHVFKKIEGDMYNEFYIEDGFWGRICF